MTKTTHDPHEFETETDEFLEEVHQGLGRQPKELPCKYFYDERGSMLFDRICELDEYYPTRTELGIMDLHAAEMASLIGAGCLLVEFGSGSSHKTRLLLEHLERPAAYVPVDISKDHMLRAAAALSEKHPELRVLPVVSDFTREFALPVPEPAPERTVVYFPGSTIGNFDRPHARDFLAGVAHQCGPHGGLLIGVDLVKDQATLLRAYDDAEGVTAAFNLNLLEHINRELDADFELEAFRHLARYDAEKGRIEMHLVSERAQTVHVAGRPFEFAEGESIHTESSHKYTLEQFASLARDAGWRVEKVWTDPRSLFSVQYLTAS